MSPSTAWNSPKILELAADGATWTIHHSTAPECMWPKGTLVLNGGPPSLAGPLPMFPVPPPHFVVGRIDEPDQRIDVPGRRQGQHLQKISFNPN
jgi:hypothetical protein